MTEEPMPPMTPTPDIDTSPSRLANERADLTAQYMRHQGLDHLLLQSPDNIRYVSDYRSLLVQESADHTLCVIDRSGYSDVFAPHLKEPVQLESPPARVRTVSPLTGWTPLMAEPATTIATIIPRLQQAKAVGYDAVHPALLDGLRTALPRTTFRYVGDALFGLRRKKLPGELDLMRRAATQNAAAINAAFAGAVEGMRDRDLMAISLHSQQAGEAELITHSTCVVAPSIGNWFMQNAELTAGHAFFIDQCFYGTGGYASDLTRTAHFGIPSKSVANAYRRLVEVTGEVIAAAKPGVAVDELDDALNRGLRAAGLSPSPYGLGHGIGLRAMEPPSLISRGYTDMRRHLLLGETIAIEPETAIEVDGVPTAIKIEDCYVVEATGLRALGDTAPNELPVLCV